MKYWGVAMSKKKNKNPTFPGLKGNKRQRKKKLKQEQLRLAGKVGISEKQVKSGQVSKDDFIQIVTREARKEQGTRKRQETLNRKKRYAREKGIPEKYLSGLSKVKESDLDAWIRKTKAADYKQRKIDVLTAKGVHPDWIQKLVRENGIEKLQNITPDLFPHYFEPKQRNKFNPDKYYTFSEWFYCGIADVTGNSSPITQAAFFQTLTTSEAGRQITEIIDHHDGKESAGHQAVLRTAVGSQARVEDEMSRWESWPGNTDYQTVHCTNVWSLNKALRTTAFIVSCVTEEYAAIYLGKMKNYLKNNNPKMYEEFIKNL